MDGEKLTPKQVINDIRQNKYGISSDGQQREDFKEISSDLRSAIAQLSTGLYGEDVHFILELIQNAEDNHYTEGVLPDLKFVVLDKDPTNTSGSNGCLCIFNNECGFAEENIRSICATGKSTKTKKEGYIGEKGIGFKSVFTATDEPHIYSNGYQFKFKGEGIDPNIELAFVVPYWIKEQPKIAQQNEYTTCLLLPIKDSQRKGIEDELTRIDPESILFLSRLENLSVHLEASDQNISLIRDVSSWPRVDLLVNNNGQDEPFLQYWMARKLIHVPDDIHEPKRDQIKERQVVVAFPLSGNNSPGTLYAYLPTEVQSGLPFLVNADFLLTANRESIQVNKPWNVWLRDSIAEVVVQGLIDLASEKACQHQVCSYIPVRKQLKSLEDFLKPICKKVSDSLREEMIVLASTGEMISPDFARMASREERALFQSCVDQKAFVHFKFIDSRLDQQREQLHSIGVRELTVRDIKACLIDEDWLAKQNSQWFLMLYVFLHQSSKLARTSFKDLALTKLDKSLIRVGQDTAYLPSEKITEVERITTFTDAGLPGVNFVDHGLYELLITNREVLYWCQEKLGWLEFGYSGYLINTLLPFISKSKDIESDLLMTVTSVIVHSWHDIDDEGKAAIRQKLPLLLDSEEIKFREFISTIAVVTPRKYDLNKGWQLLFLEPRECDHFLVLSDRYLVSIGKSDRAALDLFFREVRVTDHPPLIKNVQTRYDDYGVFEQYYGEAWQYFSEDSSTIVKLQTNLPPISFLKNKNFRNENYKKALLHWLESDVDRSYSILRASFTDNGRFLYYYYSPKQKSFDSAANYYLNALSWLKSSKGYKRPSEIFIKSHSIVEIFGKSLPYLEEALSPDLCNLLGIKDEATQETVVDYLDKLSQSKRPDLAAIKKIYRYLSEYGTELEQLFKNDAVIYVPGVKKWYRKDEVVWDDESILFGDLYGWLSPDYESSGLKDFFIKKLGVKMAVDPQALANAWLQLQKAENLDAMETELKLSKIIPRLLTMVKSEEVLQDWWKDFESEALLWTRDDEFVLSDELYYNDNRYLANLFAKDVSLAWIPDLGNSVSYYVPFFEALDVQPISLAVTQHSIMPENVEPISNPKIMTRYSKQLLAYLVRSESEEQFVTLLGDGVLGKILHAEEVAVDQIEILYRIEDWDVEHLVTDRHGFIDLNMQAILIRSGSDVEEIKDDIAEFIARAVWGTRYRDNEDKVKAILSVGSESRYRKLRDKKDWGMPRELMSQVAEYIGESFLVVKDPVESVTGDTLDDEQPSPDSSNSASNNTASIRPGWDSAGSPKNFKNGDTNPENSSGQTQGSSVAQSGKTNKGYSGSHSQIGSGNSRTRSHSQIRTRGGSRRSQGIASSINRARRNTMLSHVADEINEQINGEVDHEANRLAQEARNKLGEQGELEVVEDLRAKGYEVKRMPANNKGYDIEAVNPETSEILYIEVKGDSFSWSDKGVGISISQYQFGLAKGSSFFLAVVENLRAAPRNIYYIQDPVNHITQYRFDSGWLGLASNIKTVRTDGTGTNKSVIEKLFDLVDDPSCKNIIQYCHDNGFPYPEVGIELEDASGRVVIENIELAWEQESIGVLINGEEIEAASEIDKSWTFFRAEEFIGIYKHLDLIFNVDQKCE